MATYGYARVSTLEQAEGLSLAEQERKVRAVAAYHGVEMDEVVIEPGVSGTVPFSRRQAGGVLFAKLTKDDTLIVSKLDRAFRDTEDALATSRMLREAGVKLIVADIGVEPVTGEGTGKVFFTILAAIGDFERARIRERTQEGRRAKRERGGHLGGRTPFGYRRQGIGRESVLVEDYAEQTASKWIREQHAAGVASRKISEDLQTYFGFKLSHVAVCRVINRHQAQA